MGETGSDDPSGSNAQATKRFTESTLARLERDAPPFTRCTLVFQYAKGSNTVVLEQGKSVTVGRCEPADVVVPVEGLSRRHATFSFGDDGVWVEDLGSTNGTRVAGKEIDRAKLKDGDDVSLGDVTVSVLLRANDKAKLYGLLDHDTFVHELEEELVRATYFGRPLALLMIREALGGTASPNLSSWTQHVKSSLRLVDRMALYGPGQIEVLMVEQTLDVALATARTIVERGSEPRLFAGVGAFPATAATPDELLEVTREATQSATEHEPVRAAKNRATRTWPTRMTEAGEAQPIIACESMRALFDTVDRIASRQVPVLVLGETGTGKEVIARALHERSTRAGAPLCSVNCGSIPPQLIESTLFGHVQGAFTGATHDQKGIFEAANGGTVFLDEIGELPAAAQAALLRVLESKRIVRVGSTKESEVDVRVIAATHRDLEKMSEDGSFRTDLLYRLNVMSLHVPPLRERREEIAPLAYYFMQAASSANGCAVSRIEADALALLERWTWPGNVRELRNVIERAVVVARKDAITVEDLSERVREGVPATSSPKSAPDSAELFKMPPDASFRERAARFEASMILDALDATGGNQTEAAKRLDLPLRTLVYKLKTLGIKKGGYTRE